MKKWNSSIVPPKPPHAVGSALHARAVTRDGFEHLHNADILFAASRAMHPSSTLFHNPQCSTSRKALALLREHGIEPHIVQYLITPVDRDTLMRLMVQSGRPVRDFVRRKEPLYAELGLDADDITDAERLDALVAHPRLLERPIVVTALGTRLGRPLEDVLDILPAA